MIEGYIESDISTLRFGFRGAGPLINYLFIVITINFKRL